MSQLIIPWSPCEHPSIVLHPVEIFLIPSLHRLLGRVDGLRSCLRFHIELVSVLSNFRGSNCFSVVS